ncbi:MAG: FimV/HubP family polar landmark protein [Gammaproteobacteria bacterium]
MPRKSVPLFLTALLSAPLPVFALGLGEISLDSALNEPLVATISLDAVQSGDLTNFRAAVASGETFSRYGLDRPDFLNNLRFDISVDSGSPQLLVRSTTPITEPFVTFLVEANWDSGRLLREYTVLLDPPVFNPNSAAPPLRVPSTANTQLSSNSGFVPRREPPPAPRAPRPSVAAITGDTYGPVRRNQTLWAIAERAREGTNLSINQMMIAIYRANPDAFLGNINLLKEGSTLSLPGASSVAQISRQDAFTAARDHNQRWRAGGTVARTPSTPAPVAASTDDGRRLKLVAPDGGDTADGLSALQQQLEEEQTRNGELNDQIEQLRTELAESERLFNLRNSDLADMQARLAEEQGDDAAVDVTQTEFEPVATEAPTDTTTETTEPVVADVSTDPVVDTTPTDPVSEPEPATVTPPVVSTPAPIQSAPSLLDRILGFWPALLAGLLAIGGFLFWRSRQSADPAQDSETWEALSRDSAIPTTEVPALTPEPQMEVTEGPVAGEDVEYFEDTGTFKPIDFSEAESDVGLEREAENADAPAPAVDFPFEDTLAGEDSLKLDQSDPLAEADFHIAYGLYDQAADLVRAASEREPERRDLKMKLLEIFFVWGNTDSFLSSAQALRNDIGDGADRDWDKVIIMGRQICPGDDLFSGDAVAASADVVDLQLDETGETPIDLSTGESSVDESMDLDLGDALEASADVTGTVDNVIDFDFTGATAATDDENETIREKLEAAADGGEDTEEIDLSDLGADLDFQDSTAIDEDLGAAPSVVEGGSTGEAEVLDIDIGEDFDELFGGLDDVSIDVGGDDAVIEPPAPDLSDVAQAETQERDKLLDTSELKVEMEELLASAAGMKDDVGGETEVVDEAFSPTDETGSFSAEIQSLADDSLDIDIDFSTTDDDDDATELMEGISIDDTQAGNPAEAFSEDVFGSDDATVLSPALGEGFGGESGGPDAVAATDESFGDDEFGEIFADDADSGTAVLNVADQDFSGDNEATVLAQMPIGDLADEAGSTNTLDEASFAGVFDEAVSNDGGDDVSLDLGEDFSASVFGDDAVSGDDSTQESMAIDLDVGDALFEDNSSESGDNTTVKVAAQELALPDLDEGGSSEVGTKLDLARAYMEMGDPDGARGILQEVINEGDDGQKQDARALMDALP